LIKKKRAYAKEEKSDDAAAIAGYEEDPKKSFTGPDKDAYHKSITKNAIQNLKSAMKTVSVMKTRLKHAEDDEDAVDKNVDL
jgi:hypothetical protein